MKTKIISIAIGISAIFMLAGCANLPKVVAVYAPKATKTMEALPDQDKKAEPVPQSHTFTINGSKIIRDGQDCIYDAAQYEKYVDDCSVSNLISDGESLFFMEYGANSDESNENINSAIVSTDLNGRNRKVLITTTNPNGYSNLIFFEDRIVFIEEGFDSVYICDMKKDGTDRNRIDWAAYTAQYHAPDYFSHVELSVRSDGLYAELGMFEEEFELGLRFVRIDKDFCIHEIPPDEDRYLFNGTKIFLVSKDTGERSEIYDASSYYEEDVHFHYSCVLDDSLFFIEETKMHATGQWNGAIVCLHVADMSRQVLCPTRDDVNYEKIELFNGHLFFLECHKEKSRIGCVAVNGGEISYVDLPLEYENDHIDELNATEDTLLVNMRHIAGDYFENYTLAIDKDLCIKEYKKAA